MSEENVEIVRKILYAWNRSDFDAAWDFRSSDLVIDRSRSLVDPRVYCGTDQVARFWSDWRETWAKTHWEIEEFIDAGDDVVVLGRFQGRGVKSHAPVEAIFAQVMTVRDRKLVRSVLFQTRSEALEAAGLSKQGDSGGERSARTAEGVSTATGIRSASRAGLPWLA